MKKKLIIATGITSGILLFALSLWYLAGLPEREYQNELEHSYSTGDEAIRPVSRESPEETVLTPTDAEPFIQLIRQAVQEHFNISLPDEPAIHTSQPYPDELTLHLTLTDPETAGTDHPEYYSADFQEVDIAAGTGEIHFISISGERFISRVGGLEKQALADFDRLFDALPEGLSCYPTLSVYEGTRSVHLAWEDSIFTDALMDPHALSNDYNYLATYTEVTEDYSDGILIRLEVSPVLIPENPTPIPEPALAECEELAESCIQKLGFMQEKQTDRYQTEQVIFYEYTVTDDIYETIGVSFNHEQKLEQILLNPRP